MDLPTEPTGEGKNDNLGLNEGQAELPLAESAAQAQDE